MAVLAQNGRALLVRAKWDLAALLSQVWLILSEVALQMNQEGVVLTMT